MSYIKQGGRRGLQLPDEVALVGFDDNERAALASVPLTSVKQTVASLLRRIGALSVESYIILHPDLAVRAPSLKPGLGDVLDRRRFLKRGQQQQKISTKLASTSFSCIQSLALIEIDASPGMGGWVCGCMGGEKGCTKTLPHAHTPILPHHTGLNSTEKRSKRSVKQTSNSQPVRRLSNLHR